MDTHLKQPLRFFLGYDEREAIAYSVARHSILRHARAGVSVEPICRQTLGSKYWRQTEKRDGVLWDAISDAPMSTDFAIARFFVPHLTGGWALFADCDILLTDDIWKIFDAVNFDDPKAVYVVQHHHNPREAVKMDGQVQTVYRRKNWSSVILWNCDHPAHARLTLEYLNSVPGRTLHAFDWLHEHEIGELHQTWNYLAGVFPLIQTTPKLIHYTVGGPWFDEYRDVDFGELWVKEYDGLRELPGAEDGTERLAVAK